MNLAGANTIFIDRQSDVPAFVQVCDSIRSQINAGHLKPQSRLSPSRSLAIELGVSRTTIISAYDQLVAEGYIEGRRGSGVFVCAMAHVELNQVAQTKLDTQPAGIKIQGFEEHRSPADPDMRLFPYKKWAQYVARIARLSPQVLVEKTQLFGDIELRSAIARYLAKWRGLNATPGQILITAGSGEALEICVRTLLKRGSTIGLEDPGYLPLRNFVSREGLTPGWLNIGKDGTEVPASRSAANPPKLVVLTPSHQFPLGGAMSPGRRTEFLNWADKTGGWIIEDDYDSEFRYAGRPIPAMAGFDHSGRTIYVGSFSKIFSNSMRLGFLVAPPELVAAFNRTLLLYGSKTSVGSQRALAAFMDDGEFYRHIRRVRRVYGDRRLCLLDNLKTELAHLVSFVDHQAGMQLALSFPWELDDKLIAESIVSNGGVASALSTHYADKNSGNGLLLGFCSFTLEEITVNTKIVRREIERCLI